MAERKTIGVWISTVLVAAVYCAAAYGKLSGVQEMVDNFHRWGFSNELRLFVGSAELIGALGLLIPATATLAASGLSVIMVGAIFTHLANHEGPMALVPLVLLCLVLWIAYRRRDAVGSWLGAAEAH